MNSTIFGDRYHSAAAEAWLRKLARKTQRKALRARFWGTDWKARDLEKIAVFLLQEGQDKG